MDDRSIPTYTAVEGWEQLPDGLIHRDVCGVAVNSEDRVLVLTRNDPRVIVYDRDGSFVTSWNESLFTNGTHGVRVGTDGSVYCVSNGDHTVRKFSADGDPEMIIGTPNAPSKTSNSGGQVEFGGPPFNAPTGLTLAPNGDLYVSDGYGNARVHQFSAEGTLIRSWGEPGTDPGQFNLPHAVWYTDDNRLLVADRENDRIQVFDPEGRFLEEWTDIQRPTDICMDKDGLVYVSELKWLEGETSGRLGPIAKELHGRVSILDRQGSVLSRIGGPDGEAAGSFWAPHAICVDSIGDLYVGEVCYSFGGFGKSGQLPEGTHTLQKLARDR